MTEAHERGRNDGELGRTFQQELVASARALWGDVLGDRCNIPDEKRGGRSGYWGEKRIADLVIPAPGGRTLYIEAKATKLLRWEWRKLTDSQRDGLRMLADNGHTAWLLLLFRPQEPVDGKFVNEVYAFPDWAALKLAERSASVPREFCAKQAEDGLKVPWGVPLVADRARTWDLRVLLGEADL